MAQVNKQQAFQILIEGLVKDGISTYLDVITDYMEKNDLEAKQVKKLISPILQEKIKSEAIKNKLISDSDSGSTLPL
jgi:hypothetical protein